MAITEGNLLSTVIDHEHRIGSVEDKQRREAEHDAKLAADMEQRKKLLYTILGGVIVGVLLNLAEHFMRWGP